MSVKTTCDRCKCDLGPADDRVTITWEPSPLAQMVPPADLCERCTAALLCWIDGIREPALAGGLESMTEQDLERFRAKLAASGVDMDAEVRVTGFRGVLGSPNDDDDDLSFDLKPSWN